MTAAPAGRGARAWLTEQGAWLVVLLVVVAGVLWAVLAGWRVGLSVVAVGLAAGAVARGVLPEAEVGALAVRGRVVDTLMLGTVAAVMAGVAYSLG